ncbi:MAG TPA: hypothetical protein VHC90_25525 [Bryobacteraceae bacterium]|nr:hypothetical protein [Bryobacteraceae bacterium]
MQLDWSTFVLEIVNFLVLIWILKRFLYKPVLQVIEQRKAAIDKALAEADAGKAEAAALEKKYEARLSEWNKEKETLRENLRQEIQLDRDRLTAELNCALQQERERQNLLAGRRIAEMEKHATEEGIREGLQFTARLFARIAGPELESRLVNIALEDLAALPPATRQSLQKASAETPEVRITTAFPLAAPQRGALIQAIGNGSAAALRPLFREDAALLAGARINVGPWVLRANLQDELSFFAGKVRDAA